MNAVVRGGELVERALLPLTGAGLVLGIALASSGESGLAAVFWAGPAALVGVWLAVAIVRDLLDRQAGVDVIAILAIVGALLLDEYLAASVIGVMLATGQWLERYAAGRARRELSALVSRAPRTVNRREGDALIVRAVDEVEVGDRLVVRSGEVVPVDGTVVGSAAVLDESAVTGESRQVVREPGDKVTSGTVNAASPFELVAIASAEHSTYAGIVRLVEAAQKEKAPFVRLADRYALLFVPLSLSIAGAAWLLSGDPVRALAVLVVATPCPLLLAAPIAIVAGISRAARHGIIVKGGGALEAIARVRVLLFDKTGTLTAGRPRLADVVAAPDRSAQEVVHLAASVEQLSPHVLAGSVVAGARERGAALSMPERVEETAGAGVTGEVEGHRVAVGTLDFVTEAAPRPPDWARQVRRRANLEGATTVWVAIDGSLAGVLVLEDPIRPETPRVLRSLRREGVDRIVIVTGDHAGVADLVGLAIGADGVLAERTPADKVDAVAHERRMATGLLAMVGDGINDAPALAAADIGVAMGARGATASSEAADIVITVDRLDRLHEAIRIARRSRSIALQSVFIGMGLSIAAMLFATTGYLPPVAGALLQEGIDVIVIVNALRALGGGVPATPRIPGMGEVAARLARQHQELQPSIEGLRGLADRLGSIPPQEARQELAAVRDFLFERLVPHEEQEDREVFPLLARSIGSEDLTAGLHRTHTEIFHLIRFFDRLVREAPEDGPAAEDLTDLRRVLYGLDAILRLHIAQEEELYLMLADGDVPEVAPAVSAAA